MKDSFTFLSRLLLGATLGLSSTAYSYDIPGLLSRSIEGGLEDGIVVNPSGEKKIYSRSSVSVMPLGDTAGETEDYGFAGVLVFGENGEVYLKNPFSQFVTDTYIKGVATQDLPVKSDEPNKLVFELPQLVTIYEEDGESYDLYACMLSFSEDGTELETSDSQTLEFILEDGCWVMLDSEAILGLTFDDSEWTGFAEREIKYAPISQEIIEVPSDLEYESWMMTYGNEGHYVDVAVDGKNCYVKNFLPTSEDSLAPVVGEIENDVIRFKSPQYLGVNEDISYLTYFYAGDVNRIYLEEYNTMVTTFIPKDEMTFNMSSGGIYTSEESAMFTPYTDIENDYFWHIDLFEKPSLQKSVVEDYVPANPSVVDYRYYSNFGFGYVSFDIPMLNREGMVLDSEHLYYNVYLDGEILEFNSDEYPLFEESMTDIPYNFEDGVNGSGDIKLEDSKHTVILYREGLEEVGIQSFYLDDSGDKYYSDLITAFTSGVDKLFDDCGIVDVKYIDMMGRETRHPENGIFVRRVLLNNGSVISTKVRIK